NVPVLELEDYGYSVDQVKRFNRMPIVMVTLSKAENVMKILMIRRSMAQAALYDKNKSRPKYHFKQCRNYYKFNHIAKECPQKRKTCKYCGLKNHEASKCRHKNEQSRHQCILCKKSRPSGSVQCEVIRKAREKIGIKLTRKEGEFLMKKESQSIPIKHNVQHQPKQYSSFTSL
ncbi:hypothetical protein RFI_36779, partial [Reticulomyxa filosa]